VKTSIPVKINIENNILGNLVSSPEHYCLWKNLPLSIKRTKLDVTWLKGARGPGCTNLLFTCRDMVRRITPSVWGRDWKELTIGPRVTKVLALLQLLTGCGALIGLRQSLTTGGTKHTACQPQVTITVWPSAWRVICHAQSKLNIVLVATMEWIQYRGLTYNGHIIQQFYCLVRMPLYIDNRDCSSQKRQSKTQYLDLYIFIFYCIFFL